MLIEGFDYSTWSEIKDSLAGWKKRQADVLSKGGRRRTYQGETFLHDANGVFLYEVYAIIPTKRERK